MLPVMTPPALTAKSIAAANGKIGSPLAQVPICIRCDALSDLQAWKAWTGRAPDLVHAFGLAYTTGPYGTNVGTFDACLGAIRSLCDTWAGQPLAWALPLCTNSQGLAAVAAGTHDGVINAIADAILAHNPVGPIFCRPGWEFALPTGWPWTATSVAGSANWVAAFQRYADLLHAKSPRIKVVWCTNLYCYDHQNAEVDPTSLYPGDAYVDVIGIDAYLIGADVSSAMTFNRMSQNKVYVGKKGFSYGFKYLANFARAHSKEMAIDEWGVGADRPDYVRDMAQFIANPANKVSYHGYWNKNAPVGSPPYQFPCRLTPDGGNNYPLAKQAFLDAFYGKGRGSLEQPETGAYFARATNPPATARRTAVDTLISTLKRLGLIGSVDGSSALDGLFIFAAADSELARVGVNLPGGFTTTVPVSTGRGSENAGLNFLADRGYMGDGVGAYFGCGLNLTAISPAGLFSQNSGHMGLWSLTAVAPAAQQFECGANNQSIGMNNAGAWVGRPNQAATVTLVNSGSGPGHVLWNRTGAATWSSYFNGAAARSGTDASAALTNANLSVCGIPGVSFGSQRIAVFHWGRALLTTGNQNEVSQLYTALSTYLTAIGAI